MRLKRITALLAALCCAAQSFAGMPVSASLTEVPLADFAAAVQKLTARDAGNDFYEKIDFHKNTGTLYVDDLSAGQEYGDLSVRNGSLCVKNKNASGSRSLTAAVVQEKWLDFEEAAADYGYEYTVHGDTVTLTNEFQTARLIVKAAGRLDSLGAVSAAEGYRDLHIFQYADAAAAYQAYQQYKKNPRVQYVQPSHRVTLCQSELSGLDDHSYNTWGASAIGAEQFFTEWLKGKTLPEVKVAVIDTGINDAHAIFEGRILEGGINISDSGDDSIADDLGHGTHCTGTICELTPDNVKVLPIKIFDKEGKAADEQIYLGMVYAMEQGAQIASMSFGGLGISPLEIEACELVNAQGMLCVAAAGNHADDAAYYYPGSIESCITVGAVDENMQRAAFSNYGELVDVMAPGVGIVSYTVGEAEHTEKMNGTSMATPHVSACCALLKSYDPSLTPKRVEDLIKLNAKDLGEPGFDEDTAWGLVNLKDFRWDDGICRSPVFSEESGNYGNFVTLELTTDTEGAAIYYSTDGTVPTPETGILYTEPFTLTETAQVIAIAAKDGFVTSAPSEGAFSVGGEDVPGAFQIEDGVLKKYRGIRKVLNVPESVGSQRITAVAAEAFAGNHYLTQVILPESVTSLGSRAFAECPILTQISAYGVQEIGAEAFSGCAMLESAAFAKKMNAVGKGAFSGCTALLSLSLDGITEIPDALCEDCALLETVSAQNAVRFGEKAFYQCSSMKSIACDWEAVAEIGSLAFSGCGMWNGDLGLYALESLGEAAFSGDSSLMRVSLSESITELPSCTFQGCSGLRLLQLPAVTVLKDHALAVRSVRSDLVTELDYSKITDVEESAFYGFLIGDGYETVTFSALSKIRSRAFAGAQGGALSFPQITAVPDYAFMESSLRVLYLEKVKSLGTDSLTGCTSAVFSSALKKIAKGAWSDGFWIVTQDTIPALKSFENYEFCQEPLVLVSPNQDRTVQQHHPAALRALAAGVKLRYRWYTVSGGELTEIPDAKDAVFYADTAEIGTVQYRCIMTDAGGKTEQINFTVHTAEAAAAETLTAGEMQFPDKKTEYMLTVPKTGDWVIDSYGAALMTGRLYDSHGAPVGTLRAEQNGTSVTAAALKEGEQYLLTAEPMQETVCSLLLSDRMERTMLRGAEISLSDPAEPQYGGAYQPAVTVTLNGTALDPGTDFYTVITEHNQNRTVSVFGKGAYSGFGAVNVPVYPRVPADTPIPVSLSGADDRAVFLFVPRESGTYYYYATTAAGYAEEQAEYLKRGNYGSGSRFVNIHTHCAVCDTPDGSGTVFDENSFNVLTGYYFCSKVDLSAGQSYYFICDAESAAEYALVISQECRNLRNASIYGEFYAVHKEGKPASPEITVMLDETELQEGVDYQRIDIDSDLPGEASVKIVGMGLYTGTASQSYRIIYTGKSGISQRMELDSPTAVECVRGRTEKLWFSASGAKSENDTLRYRVLNERVSGGKMAFSIFRYDPSSGSYAMMQPMPGQTTDYELTNGAYCIVVHRVFANVAAKANFTVLKPYSLNDAEITVYDAVYTGDAVIPDMEVIADGVPLELGKDFTISFPDDHIMFGELHYNIKSNKRSYGNRMGVFNIKVVLPEDVPLISVGEYEAEVTFEDRLAVYRVCPEEETTYVLASSDVMNTVLRVFNPDAVMLEQAYGAGAKSLTFTVPAGETRYIMVKFNGTARMGTLHFQLETSLRLLSACEITADPVSWTGERVLPELHFRDGDYELAEGKDYRIRYSYNDVNPGRATVNCVGLGKYFGNADVDYQIILPELFTLENFESIPVALDVTYKGTEKTKCPYLIYRYTAGTETELHLDIVRSAVKLNVQRYDSQGHWQESLFVKPDGFTEFVLDAGETAYFLLSATDISGYNQVYDFELTALRNTEYKIVLDAENGVTYRILTDGSYAEVCALNTELSKITLLPEIEGVPVRFITEGAFYLLPEQAAVVGYSGCDAAKYADLYRFAYQENAAAGGSSVQGDLNGDGRFTVADAVLLSRVLAEQTEIIPAALRFAEADCNADGTVDVDDLQAMLTKLTEKTNADYM